LSQPIKARITNYHIGIRAQASRECLIQLAQPNPETPAGSMLGSKVVWKNATTQIVGKVVGLHGRKGMLVAKFPKGVPGQAIGSLVELIC